MHFDEPLIIERDIESAIDRQPLLVTPDTPLFEVIVLMSQRSYNSQNPCIVADSSGFSDGKRQISSFALVVEGEKLLGIFTERDIVKLAAEGRDIQTLTIREVMTPDVITLHINSLRDVFGPLFLFRRYKIRHLPIVGDRGELIGIISQDSIRQLVRPIDFLKLKRVSEVMTTSVINAPLTTSVSEIAQLMTVHGVSCVVITQETKLEDEENLVCPVGIVTERDIVQFQALQLNLVQTTVETVMSTPLFLLQPEDSLWTAYQEMQGRKVRRLVVSWDWGKGIGIVTQTNLLQSLELKEIFEVEETVEKTVQASESQKIQQILNQKIEQQEQLESSLLRLYENLGNIFSKTNISPHIPQSQVQSVLFDIGEMRDLVRKMNQETKDLQKLARINFDEDGSIYPSQTVIEHEQNIDDEIGENFPKSLPKIATGG
jgi:CBS domain-containing protein